MLQGDRNRIYFLMPLLYSFNLEQLKVVLELMCLTRYALNHTFVVWFIYVNDVFRCYSRRVDICTLNTYGTDLTWLLHFIHDAYDDDAYLFSMWWWRLTEGLIWHQLVWARNTTSAWMAEISWICAFCVNDCTDLASSICFGYEIWDHLMRAVYHDLCVAHKTY